MWRKCAGQTCHILLFISIMPDFEAQHRPEQQREAPVDRTERSIPQIESRIPFYRQNITKANPLEIDGYDPKVWNTQNVMTFENNLFFASHDGVHIVGFQIVKKDENGDQISQLDMAKFPMITLALKEKFGIPVTPAPERAEKARRIEQDKRPEAHLDGSVESVLSALQQISVEAQGERLPMTWPSVEDLSHYLRANGVPPTRFGQYVRNMRDHANLLSAALRASSFRGEIRFDYQHLIASDGRTTLQTTATRVLKKVRGGNFTTLDSKPVSITEKTITTEYRVGGLTETHRRDGGLATRKDGKKLGFYDGSNSRPLMEKNEGHVTVDGPYGSVVVGRSGDAVAYAHEIAANLRTPEAIGAFVSQFYYGQDYKGETPENREWLQNIQKLEGNAVRYVGDGVRETIQNWQTTLSRGAGDCEDFALLAEGLLRQAGISSFAMLVEPKHYESVYFEQAADGQYYACTVGLKGFSRSTKTFPTLGAAAASLWEGGGSGAQFALTKPDVRAKFANPRDPNRYPENAPGIFQLRQPGDPGGNSDMIEYSDEKYFAQFVRR